MDKLYIIIPAYNEEKNIKAVIESWYPVLEKYGDPKGSCLVIINDGSRDDTYNVAKAMEKDFPMLSVLTKENSGHASSCMFGYVHAIKQGADLIFQTDSDGQTLPEDFGPFYEAISDNDVVLGVRHKRGDGMLRLIISRVLSAVVRFTFHVRVPDANVPFRLMKKEALSKALLYVPGDYDLAQVVLSATFEKLGFKTCYLPVSFVSREAGESMYNIGKFIKIGLNALGEFVAINREIDAKIEKGTP